MGRVQGWIQGSGFRVQGSGFRVQGLGGPPTAAGDASVLGMCVVWMPCIQRLAFGFRGSGFRVSGFGFRVAGFGFRVSD